MDRFTVTFLAQIFLFPLEDNGRNSDPSQDLDTPETSLSGKSSHTECNDARRRGSNKSCDHQRNPLRNHRHKGMIFSPHSSKELWRTDPPHLDGLWQRLSMLAFRIQIAAQKIRSRLPIGPYFQGAFAFWLRARQHDIFLAF